MEIASPLIDKFLPGDILSRISESELSTENKTLGVLCFYSAFNYFIKQNLFDGSVSDADSKHGQIQRHICTFLAGDDRLLFDNLHVLIANDEFIFKPMSNAANERLIEIGTRCCNKAIFPFAANKPKSADFIVTVASSFERVYRRLHPMWQVDASGRCVTATTLLLNELILLSGVGRWDLCASLCTLALEVMCLNTFQLRYLPLSDADKADPTHYITRGIFWCASFFYDTIRRGWDKEDDLCACIDAALDAYVLRSNEVMANRGVYSARVDAVFNRVQIKQETLTRLHRFLQTFHPSRDATIRKLVQNAAWLESKAVEAFGMSAADVDTFREYTQFISITVELLEAEYTDAAPSVINPLPAQPNIAAVVARLFGEEDVPSDEERRKKKKKSRNQRQRVAREKHAAELARILDEVCEQVANEVAAEAAEERRQWLEARFQLDVQAADHRIRRIVEARRAQERLAAARSSVSDQVRSGALPASFVLDLLDGLLSEEEIAQRAYADVLWQVRMGRLPRAYLLELARLAFPAMENMLEPAPLECFVCMQPMDLRHLGAGYLVCCDGGSFACADCIATHAASDRHPLRMERRIVDLAVCVRHGLRLGEVDVDPVVPGVAEEMAARARLEVMRQLRMTGTLPNAFLQDLVRGEFPVMERMLGPTMRCGACMQPLRAPGVGYLVCCELFACQQCIHAHAHPPRVETQLVALTASLRRHLRLDD